MTTAFKENIIETSLVEEMKSSHLQYAMAVIVGRAIPDVRDGLKTIHRRILFVMKDLGLLFDKPYMKSARIAGEVMGKYHPHSGQYSSMVTIAAAHTREYPLIDGQGNWGTLVDGAAAERYTEARLSRYAQMALLAELTRGSVDWRPNYDESLLEPTVLPALLPNLLLSDTEGIAVGYACSHLPYNLGEVASLCQANIKARLKGQKLSPSEILEHIKGPDFVSGGVMLKGPGISDAILYGRGSVRLAGEYHLEQVSMPGKRNKTIQGEAVVVSSLPFKVDSEHLMEELAELSHEGKLEDLIGLQNESARGEVRLVLMFRQGANIKGNMDYIYGATSLSKTFSANALAISNMSPKVFGVNDVVTEWLQFRVLSVQNFHNERLQDFKAKRHIAEGLTIVLNSIDKAVQIIKGSATAKIAKAGLLAEFGLSDIQAQAVLDMPLRRLIGIELDELLKQLAQLEKDIKWIEDLLSSEKNILKLISGQIKDLAKDLARPRRTQLFELPPQEPKPEPKPPEAIHGWIWYLHDKVWTVHSHVKPYHEALIVECDDLAQHWLIVIMDDGKAYRIRATDLSVNKNEPIKQALARCCKGVNPRAKVVFYQTWTPGQWAGKSYAVLTTEKFKLGPEYHFDNIPKKGTEVVILEPGETIIGVVGFLEPNQKLKIMRGNKELDLSHNILQNKKARGVKSYGATSISL